MSPHFLHLSTELLIQIVSYGSLRDIGAFALTSRRLYDIISGSLYLRYLIRTKIAGVYDPFLTGLSIHERLSVLESWERAWHDLDLRKPTLHCVVPRHISVSVLRYEIHSGYLIGTRRLPADDRPLGYIYVNLHEAIKRGYVSWNNVDLHQSLSVFSHCFNVEDYNLAVMLVYNLEEQPEPHASLRVMDFRKGSDHPLSTSPNIQLQFGGKATNINDAHDAHMGVAGDNIIVMITQERALPDYIFLVGWKSGMVSLILTAPDLTYAASFALLNTELFALLNLQANTLDIHRIPEGSSCVLQRVGQLSLPFSQPLIPLCSAAFQQAQACPSSHLSRPRCLPFYLSPDACLVGLTVIAMAKDDTMTFYWFGIRPDFLSSIPDETKRDSSSSDRPTPWETWSLRTAGCFEIEHSLAAPIPAGARWLIDSQSLVVREFGPSRSKKTDQKTRNDDVADDIVRRETPQDVFASQPQLPYCDVKARMGEKYQSVIADYEWVVGMSGGSDDFSRTIDHIDIHHVV